MIIIIIIIMTIMIVIKIVKPTVSYYIVIQFIETHMHT